MARDYLLLHCWQLAKCSTTNSMTKACADSKIIGVEDEGGGVGRNRALVLWSRWLADVFYGRGLCAEPFYGVGQFEDLG